MFQIPCFCEVCLNEMTQSMKPTNGYTTELHQGWIWEHTLYPGQCQDFEIILDGYAPMEEGYYKVMGDNRYIEGAILVPNPCEPSIGYPMHYELTEEEKEHLIKGELVNNDEEMDKDDICFYDSPLYPDQDCSYVCYDYLDNEWRVDYVLSYNADGNTVFVYHAFVESNVDHLECTKKAHTAPQRLAKVYLRV